MRQFCLKQQYYSLAAYKSLRSFFNNNLPAHRTLQLWYTSIDGSPGISESALDVLREKAASYLKLNCYPLHVCLMSDEMSIRKQICWSNELKSFIGFSTITNSSQQGNDEQNTSQLKVAKDALVFMVVGPDFKIAIAYYLLNGLEAIDRAALTLKVTQKVEETNSRVMSFTADGLIANITTSEILGANFNDEKPFFFSPTHPQQKIYFVLDPCHMLKLVRKHFSSDQIYHLGQLLDWNVLCLLSKRQCSDNFNLCNKLTRRHINWNEQPMNVKLAVQTISKSVADSLEQLRKDDYEEFKDSEATEEFLRFFNDAFDILNFAEKSETDDRYKKAICEATAEEIFSFADTFKEYITRLEVRFKTKNVPVLKSTIQRGFFGFYHNFTSLKGIYEDFVLNGPLKTFYPFQFSQDHLESFFSLVRYVFE